MKFNNVEQKKKDAQKPIKDYLYLNMDFLESFIAQIDGGYNALQISDDTVGSKDIRGSKTFTVETGIEGKLNEIIERLIKLDAEAKITTQSAPVYNIDTNLSKNVIIMKQRENILDRFIDYLGFDKPNSFVNSVCDDDIGKYVALHTYFDYINFSRLGMLTNIDSDDFRENFSEGNGLMIEKLNIIKAKLPLLKTLFPFDTFLYARGIIVLINNDYLRDKKEEAGYKFNSMVKVIGTVNKLASTPRVASVPASATMDEIQIFTLSLLRELGFVHENDKEIYLVTPIAIYV